MNSKLAIETLKQIVMKNKVTANESNGLKLAIRTLEQKQNDKWISVNDEMPKEHDSVFAKFYGTDKWDINMFRRISNDVCVVIECKDGERIVTVLRTKDGVFNIARRAKVTHWQAMPELPKE